MTPRLFQAALMASGLMLPFAASAHHGWGEYEAGKAVNVAGVIETATYGNPHGELQLRSEGKVWRVILAPPSRMQNRGLAPEMLQQGRTVSVEGYPHRSEAAEMRAERITVDGKTTELR